MQYLPIYHCHYISEQKQFSTIFTVIYIIYDRPSVVLDDVDHCLYVQRSHVKHVARVSIGRVYSDTRGDVGHVERPGETSSCVDCPHIMGTE